MEQHLSKKRRDVARLSEETVVVICPNPNCGREIKEPILLAILSGTPRKEFEACPYCFTELKPEPRIEEESIPEPTFEPEEVLDDVDETVATTESEPPVLEKGKGGAGFFKKVRSLIKRSNGDHEEEKLEFEESQNESFVREEEKTEIEDTKF